MFSNALSLEPENDPYSNIYIVFLNKTIINQSYRKNAFALLVSQAIRSQYCLK